MSLAPNLFDRSFGQLMEIGRARLRSLAPDWTDHNAHDPGITLLELLAWVAEAQMYSLSRLRRDERTAYAAFFGVAPGGTRGATGLIWPDRDDPEAPAATYARSVVIPETAAVSLIDSDSPTYRPAHTLLWAPGRIERVETRFPNGRAIDHTAVNARGGVTFLPFGERAGGRAVLRMTFVARDDRGLAGNRKDTAGALWPIGVMAAPPQLAQSAQSARSAQTAQPAQTARCAPALAATLSAGNRRFDVPIAHDSTQGFMTTGVLLLNLDAADIGNAREVTIEFRAPDGFARPPRVLRIEPNVISVRQGRAIDRELHVATGAPDWSFELRERGLRFDPGRDPVAIEIDEPGGMQTWRLSRGLADSGPGDRGFELDPASGRVTFGNAVNGSIPPAGAQTLVSYAISDGAAGDVARNRQWRVAGFQGVFGVNLDPMTGGAGSPGWIDQRRDARQHAREDRALVSRQDIVDAALALPLLEVGRAWIVEPDARSRRDGVVTLVAMRRRDAAPEPEQAPETPRWLEAIRRSLLPRIQLGTRLRVAAPRYVDFGIDATVESVAGLNPDHVKAAIEEQLRKRLALAGTPGQSAREPGMPVSERDVHAWIRSAKGVNRVIEVKLKTAQGADRKQIRVPRDGLPRWISSRGAIAVTRPAAGGAR